MPATASYVFPPVHRRLRGYAFDPSLASSLQTAGIGAVTFRVRWESLAPGPVGEYLEVIDEDPASACFYEPVNLDLPAVLAQDGLDPSEGTPQFHQQMVYAVASLTIHNFERALGRKALWGPGPPRPGKGPADDGAFVRRLRIYPHALREANAYYSPAKKALLFGYFAASDSAPGDHMPGSLVFTCLSHDIVAHETAHALLDGMHRRFSLPTNPDMRAFHEAFADLVALFQHFTFPEIVRHQIARSRGDLRSQHTLLGELAGQFGRATGMRGALRSAIGEFDDKTGAWKPHVPDPAEYDRTLEPHARGAIFVAAVFDAFLSIYGSRTADLLRLYTGGTGVLPAGAIHPDLVQRLAGEAARSAEHVLTMCVRALDYCPPVDLTFGEYLRAIITADYDVVKDDDRHYRLAFVEAFRRRGIYPREMRTLSVDSLIWQTPEDEGWDPSPGFVKILDGMRADAYRQLYTDDREQIFNASRSMRGKLHALLTRHFARDGQGRRDAKQLGLRMPGRFEVHSVRFAHRVGPDGQLLLQAVLELLQSTAVPFDGGTMTFEGGCTLIADLHSRASGKDSAPRVTFCIRKRIDSTTRLDRQRSFRAALAGASLRGTYFSEADARREREPFAALHRLGY